MSQPEILTERLLLRPPVAEDLDGWDELMGDEQSARFIGGTLSRSACWRSMASMAGSWALHGFGMFSVIELDSGRWIGRLGPWRPEGWPGAEIAWALVRSAWGKGYATEGAAAALDWAITELGWTEVIHCIDPRNEPSKAVARRLGSRFIRLDRLPAPFETMEVEIWGQSASDWRERRKG